ncbi:MAG: DUF2635 domain-containing protein [Desulfobacterales bacterium]|nr:DUF2635 domain-containing protein [Desulfobacterales bacterium]
MRVKPAKGLLVRMPEAHFSILPEKGAEVPNSTYWNRRLKCGDVSLVVGVSKKSKKEG